MRRRDFIILLVPMGGWPSAVRAQQKAMPVVGFLNGGAPSMADPFMAAFHQGLSETGYVEGQNLTIEHRWAENHYDRLPLLASDLVGHKVDVIVTIGGPSALAAKSATSTIPIVFSGVGDPVGFGLVASLKAQPRRSRSSFRAAIRSSAAWSPVSPGPAAISLASATSTLS